MEKRLAGGLAVLLSLVFIGLVWALANAENEPVVVGEYDSRVQPQAASPVAGALVKYPAELAAAPQVDEVAASEPVVIQEPIKISAPANEARQSVFAAPILDPLVEVVQEKQVLATGNALLCTSGRPEECGTQSVTVTEKTGDDLSYNPFKGMFLEMLETGCARDADDERLVRDYNLTGLYACAANAASIEDVYVCTQEFNKENGGNCATSTSAFKLAFCASEAAKTADYRLYKAYADGANYNAHRWILLQNENGFYSLDPLWCGSENIDYCVKFSSQNFFENAGAKNYRGNVVKTDRIV